MTLLDRINNDLLLAMKEGDESRKLALRGVKTAITRAQKEKDNQPLSDAEIIVVLRREVKQRQDSIDIYLQAGRPDLAAKEQAEMDVITTYLPAQLDEAAIRERAQSVIAEVGATGPRDMGKVMGPLMASLEGQADGRIVNQIVRELLATPTQ